MGIELYANKLAKKTRCSRLIRYNYLQNPICRHIILLSWFIGQLNALYYRVSQLCEAMRGHVRQTEQQSVLQKNPYTYQRNGKYYFYYRVPNFIKIFYSSPFMVRLSLQR